MLYTLLGFLSILYTGPLLVAFTTLFFYVL